MNRKHSYEMFLYIVRGHVKNVNWIGSQVSFNIEPAPLHVSGININGTMKPAITLIGRRLVKTEHGMKQENDVFAVLRSTTFVCESAPTGIEDGDYHELQIEEAEAQRIKALVADSDLVVHVAGML